MRAVGFNPEAAAYGGINVKKNLIRAMAISGAFAGLAGALDMLGYLYHFGQSDIPVSTVGFLGIAVALLGRNTAVGVGLAALLFGALLFGTTHGLTSNVIQPELAGNLTYIIQGLVVLFIGADVLILYVWNARGSCGRDGRAPTRRRRRHERVGRSGSTTRSARACAIPATTGYAGLVLGVFAAFLAIPPIQARTIIWPIVVGVLAVAARHLDGDARPRAASGYGAVAAGAARHRARHPRHALGRRGTSTAVFDAPLIAQTFAFATPLVFGAIGGMFSERSGVVNIGLEGMMLMGAFWGVYGADKGGSWVVGILVGMARRRRARARLRVLRDPPARRPDRRRDGGQLPRARDHRLLLLPALPRQLHPERRLDDPQRQDPVDLGPALPRAGDRQPQPDDLGGLRARDRLVRRRLQDADRAADPRLRRASARGRHRRDQRLRASATAASSSPGILAASGGVYLSDGFGGGTFIDNMTDGRGFIALAAMIFGNWRPAGAFAAALLFGFSSAVALRLQVYSPSASTLFNVLPYVLTLIAVAGVIGRTVPPAADGKPYQKQ